MMAFLTGIAALAGTWVGLMVLAFSASLFRDAWNQREYTGAISVLGCTAAVLTGGAVWSLFSLWSWAL